MTTFIRMTPSLLLIVGLALTDVAFATRSLTMTRGMGGITSMRNITGKDRARLNTFQNTTALFGVVPAVNQDVAYTVQVLIGNQSYNLIVDTGSGNTWIGAGKPYHPSPTSIRDGRAVSVTYGSGTFSGVQYNDTIVLGNLTASDQSISVATQAQGFEGYDGILGLGPATLTAGTLAGTNALIPTVMQTLKSQGSIEQNVLGVYFQPLVGSNVTELNGELSLGGPDPSRYTGNITFTNVTSNYPYSLYWGIDIDTITYDEDNNKTILTNAAPAIVDTGTTLTYIPTATMNTFLAVSDGRIDPDTTLPAFQTKPSSNITFIISGTSLALSPDQYLVSQEQYPLFGLNQTFFYAWFGDGGASGTMNTRIQSQDAQYSVYDTTNSRVGFAPALPKGTKRKFEAGTAISATSSARKDKIISRQVRIS
ncbi:peptidase A1 family, partial [Rhizoctonia solani]